MQNQHSQRQNNLGECPYLVILLAPISRFPTSAFGRFSTYERALFFGEKWIEDSLGGSYVLLGLDHVVVKIHPQEIILNPLGVLVFTNIQLLGV